MDALPHLILAGGAIVVYLLIRGSVAALRANGARPWTIVFFTLTPVLVLAVGELAHAGLVPPESVFVPMSAAAAVILCRTCVVRATGGYRPLAALGLQTLDIERCALRAMDAEGPAREALVEQVQDRLRALDRLRFSPEASEYIDILHVLTGDLMSWRESPNADELLARKGELEATFLPLLTDWRVSGALLHWASPRRRREQRPERQVLGERDHDVTFTHAD